MLSLAALKLLQSLIDHTNTQSVMCRWCCSCRSTRFLFGSTTSVRFRRRWGSGGVQPDDGVPTTACQGYPILADAQLAAGDSTDAAGFLPAGARGAGATSGAADALPPVAREAGSRVHRHEGSVSKTVVRISSSPPSRPSPRAPRVTSVAR